MWGGASDSSMFIYHIHMLWYNYHNTANNYYYQTSSNTGNLEDRGEGGGGVYPGHKRELPSVHRRVRGDAAGELSGVIEEAITLCCPCVCYR